MKLKGEDLEAREEGRRRKETEDNWGRTGKSWKKDESRLKLKRVFSLLYGKADDWNVLIELKYHFRGICCQEIQLCISKLHETFVNAAVLEDLKLSLSNGSSKPHPSATESLTSAYFVFLFNIAPFTAFSWIALICFACL